jgi:hypothetical protein
MKMSGFKPQSLASLRTPLAVVRDDLAVDWERRLRDRLYQIS